MSQPVTTGAKFFPGTLFFISVLCIKSITVHSWILITTLICFSSALREKLIRLQHENKMLKINQEGSDNEKIALLQSLLDDASLRKNELETENR